MVSVIIPTYNRSDYIERAIESVLLQTYKNFELIIVDDNEKNSDARKILENKMKKYENNCKIKYIQHEKNLNGATARNTGIRNSNGKYITFLDDDDYYLPKRLEVLVDALEKNIEYTAAYTSSITKLNGKIVNISKANLSGNLEFDMLCQNTVYRNREQYIFSS